MRKENQRAHLKAPHCLCDCLLGKCYLVGVKDLDIFPVVTNAKICFLRDVLHLLPVAYLTFH